MATVTQKDRELLVQTPLGPDVLLLAGFRGREEISRLFHFELDLYSLEQTLRPADLVGKPIGFRVRQADGSPRWFHGHVSQLLAGNTDSGFRHYRVEVVPWLWFLSQTADCRIFQEKTIPEIITSVFQDLGFSNFSTDGIADSHPKHEYCVQYRETDFNFVSRLMEEEGIYYYFLHEEHKHTLVLGDRTSGYTWCAERTVELERSYATHAQLDRVLTWEHRYEFRPGKWAHADYNFETPNQRLLTTTDTVVGIPDMPKYEVFDYPGSFDNKGDGEQRVKLRMEEEEAYHDVVTGTSSCKTFHPGARFTITEHHVEAENRKTYVLTAVEHTAVEPTGFGIHASGSPDYRNSFRAIPESVIFRPPRSTPCPSVQGPQTAVVVGPAGEEIYCDQYGRVKVQFFWDRQGAKDENSSCWVRVSQYWAGKNWGAMHIPRIGQEVIVDFLEGDPDAPIITGRVYNADQMPPYDLPANKTVSTLKSRSSKGGTPDHFNEIRFEDKKGQEQLFIHAEKNQDIEVENDETHWVGHDRRKTIDNDETTHVKHDRTETVDHNETITILNDRTESVMGFETIAIAKNRTETVSMNEFVTITMTRTHTIGINDALMIGGAREQVVGASESITIGASQSTTIGIDRSTTIGANDQLTVGKDQTVEIGENEQRTVGKQRITTIGDVDQLTVGKKLLIDAGDEVMIKTGKAVLHMKKDGTILLKGKNITVDGAGQIDIKASKNVVVKGKKVLQN